MASLLSACVVVQDTRKGSYIVSSLGCMIMAVPAVLIGAIGASTGDLMMYILLLLLSNQIGSL